MSLLKESWNRSSERESKNMRKGIDEKEYISS